MKRASTRVTLSLAVLCLSGGIARSGELLELPGNGLRDKIQGGLLGQMLGNLNGLPHELKDIGEPGQVTHYMPSLPAGQCAIKTELS